jgi:methionine-S-sulfoxide reductase
MKLIIPFLVIFLVIAFGFTKFSQKGVSMTISDTVQETKPADFPTVYLGGGCFWCLESQIRALDGVLFTQSGYQGGTIDNPTYQQITTGKTGHAEVVAATYNPDIISYDELITFFLTQGHDATQLNRQGVDVGTQYRSVIFYKDSDEKEEAQEIIKEINVSDYYKNKDIATVLTPLEGNTFFPAEDYHQQYYEKYEESQGQPHIRVRLKEKRNAFKEN